MCLGLGGYLALARRSEHTLDRAQAALAAARPAVALSELDGLGGQAAGRAVAVRAYAYLAERRFVAADRELRVALRRDPSNWVLARDDAVVALARGRRAAARRELQRALALNPRMGIPTGFAVSGG